MPDYEIDETSIAPYSNVDTVDVAAGREPLALRGMDACPERAITIVEQRLAGSAGPHPPGPLLAAAPITDDDPSD